jgi:hypothetical protein
MQRPAPDGEEQVRPQPGVRGMGVSGLLVRAAVVLAVAAALVWTTKPDGGESSAELVGPTQPVFVWSRDACEPIDIPDTPARAFRDASGRVQLIASSYVNRRMIGPSLDEVRQSCDIVLQSGYNPSPATFSDREWIAATYTPDGRTVHAVVHDEYQGNEHPGRCSAGQYHPCWFNSLTYAVSRDGGRTYARPPVSSRLIATVPYQYEPGTGPYGIFQPSNVVRNEADGYYYVLVRGELYKDQPRGTCLLRTRDLSRPDSWRAWDGDGFDVQFVNPYNPAAAAADPAQHVCSAVDFEDIGGMTQSLTYSTYLKKWVLVGVMTTPRLKSGGIYYSVSDDLLNWSNARLLKHVELTFTFKCGDEDPIAHPSLLDPSSKSRNFQTIGREPYLYYTLVRYDDCQQTLNRDLLRVRVRFSK